MVLFMVRHSNNKITGTVMLGVAFEVFTIDFVYVEVDLLASLQVFISYLWLFEQRKHKKHPTNFTCIILY